LARSILIIDDAVFMRRLLRDVLRREGFDVREATGGSDGLVLFDEMRPELTILDFAMPDMAGFDVLKRLLERDASARVLVVSATPAHQGESEALALGARAYVSKPFQPSQLVDAVKASLRPDSLPPTGHPSGDG